MGSHLPLRQLYGRGWYSTGCLADTDGDGIHDTADDCVFDPTNSVTSCMDDLPDCSTVVRNAIAAAGAEPH